MPIVQAKCTNCGGNLEVDSANNNAICPYCKTPFLVEKAINNYSITNNINAGTVVLNNPAESDFEISRVELIKYVGNKKEVAIPDSVIHIGDHAFSGCDYINSVIIPHTVTTIDRSAFSGCTGLTSITIPDGVTSIGRYAFNGCTSLESIIVGSDNPTYYSACNCLINRKSDTLLLAGTLLLGCKNSIIPNDGSVTQIGDSAFYGCAGLTSVTIPDSVRSIGEYAFYGCTGLTSITIPNSVRSIGEYAFYGCAGLTSITIPDSVTSIGEKAFEDCRGLTSVTIGSSVTTIERSGFIHSSSDLESITVTSGNLVYHSAGNCLINRKSGTLLLGCKNSIIPNDGSVTSIGDEAFYRCAGLTSVTIPDSVTSIGSHAFYNCTGLTSVTIPDSVTSIGRDAFYRCTGLTSVTIPDSVTYTDGVMFGNCNSIKHVYIGGKGTHLLWPADYRILEQANIVMIIEGVKKLDARAFARCDITNVTIPDSVTYIDDEAFMDCARLTSVRVPKYAKYGKHVFEGCDSLPPQYRKGKYNKKNSGKGGCYVATCVYGSYNCPQVWTLRRYRDDTLTSTWYGRAFIRTYYAVSPTLVKWFGRTKWFKKMWQGKLDRMVKRLNAKGVADTPYKDKTW